MRCCLGGVVFLLSVLTAAATSHDAFVYEEFANCDNEERIAKMVGPRIVTLKPGVMQLRALANVSEGTGFSFVNVETFVCDMKRANCIPFLNWKRDTDVCALGLMKNTMWTSLFTVVPPVRCPTIHKGLYQLQNGSLDISKAAMLSLPLNKYIRIKVDVYGDKRKPFLCALLGAVYKTIKT